MVKHGGYIIEKPKIDLRKVKANFVWGNIVAIRILQLPNVKFYLLNKPNTSLKRIEFDIFKDIQSKTQNGKMIRMVLK